MNAMNGERVDAAPKGHGRAYSAFWHLRRRLEAERLVLEALLALGLTIYEAEKELAKRAGESDSALDAVGRDRPQKG